MELYVPTAQSQRCLAYCPLRVISLPHLCVFASMRETLPPLRVRLFRVFAPSHSYVCGSLQELLFFASFLFSVFAPLRLCVRLFRVFAPSHSYVCGSMQELLFFASFLLSIFAPLRLCVRLFRVFA